MSSIPIEDVFRQIAEMAKKHGVRRVTLFGSRARGDALPKSDIDLAVTGGDVRAFDDDIQENLWSLLMVDVVNLDEGVTPELQREIERDGRVLYEEAR